MLSCQLIHSPLMFMKLLQHCLMGANGLRLQLIILMNGFSLCYLMIQLNFISWSIYLLLHRLLFKLIMLLIFCNTVLIFSNSFLIWMMMILTVTFLKHILQSMASLQLDGLLFSLFLSSFMDVSVPLCSTTGVQ